MAERLRESRRGVIVAGRMAPGAAAAIARLARATGLPILAEPTSQLRLGRHDRELVIGAYEPIARARPAALEPDLVLRFGEMPTCKPLRQWLGGLERAAHLVVDPVGGWNEPTRIAGAIVRADPCLLSEALTETLGDPRGLTEWARSWLDASAAVDRAIVEQLGALESPSEPALQVALGRAYVDGDLVYTASSMPIRDQEAFLRSSDADVLFLANRGANGIDGLVSSGVGAAVSSGRPTWIVCGDLGLFHDMNALASISHTHSPVRIVVPNNDGGGIFEFLPQAEQIERDEFEALLATPLGLDLERVAGLHGLRYERVEDLTRFGDVAGDDAVLIEVPVPSRAPNVELHQRISEAAVAALRNLYSSE